jgi:hypothetical protein
MINRYLIGFAVVILLMFIGLILIFSGGDEKPREEQLKPLPEYSTTYAEASMTIDGPIVGEDQKRSIRITVGQYQRRLDVISGYNGNITQTNSFSNNESAYNNFLWAIWRSGFLKERKGLDELQQNEKGQCPLGQRYIFELNESGEQLSYLWTSSCGNKIGTLAGDSSTLQQLFEAQITDYDELVSDVEI